MAHRGRRADIHQNGPTRSLSGVEVQRYIREHTIEASKERDLREKNGKWKYRFELNDQPLFGVTDVEAVPKDIVKAHAERTAHIEELKKGKTVIRQVITSVDHGIPSFVPWYRSEHQNRESKWAASSDGLRFSLLRGDEISSHPDRSSAEEPADWGLARANVWATDARKAGPTKQNLRNRRTS